MYCRSNFSQLALQLTTQNSVAKNWGEPMYELKASYVGWDNEVEDLVDSVGGYAFYEWGVMEREWRWLVSSEFEAHRLSRELRKLCGVKLALTVGRSELAFN